MRHDERSLVKFVGVDFYHSGTAERAEDCATEVDLVCGGQVRIPLLPETLIRIVRARHASGRYSTWQVWRWLHDPEGRDLLGAAFEQGTGVKVTLVPTPAELATLKRWLHDTDRLDHEACDHEDPVDKSAVDLGRTYLPDWLDVDDRSMNYLLYGDLHAIKLPEGRTVSEVITHMRGKIDAELGALEPAIPEP